MTNSNGKVSDCPGDDTLRFPRYRHELISQPLSEIDPKAVRWLWPARIPKAKLTIILGDAGSGKSLLMSYVGSKVSTGQKLARQKKAGRPRPVIVVSFEDDPEDTVRPRFEMAGANLSLVRIIHRRTEKGKGGETLEIPRDLELLRREIQTLGAQLLVIDPLMGAWSAKMNSWRDQHTRKVLDAMADVAERTGAAICAIVHPNKKSDLKALYRASGSMAFSNVPRSVLLVAHDPDDERITILAGVKVTNLAKPISLAFKCEDVTYTAYGKRIRTARLVYIGTSDYTDDDLMSRDTSEVSRAKKLLKKLLAAGPQPSSRVYSMAQRENIAKRTLARAKEKLHVKSKRTGGIADKGQWRMELPEGR
jgi:DNA repair protein RadA/Sms